MKKEEMEIDPIDGLPDVRGDAHSGIGKSCLTKVRFQLKSDAERKGSVVYFCNHCNGYHRATDREYVRSLRLKREQRKREARLQEQEAAKTEQETKERKFWKRRRFAGRHAKWKLAMWNQILFRRTS